MTLQDLKDQIDTLCEYYNDCGVGADAISVRAAIQPNYPLRANLENICVQHRTDEDNGDLVWLAISDGLGYGVSREVWSDSDIYDENEEN